MNFDEQKFWSLSSLECTFFSCAAFCCKIDSIYFSSATCATCSNCNRASCWTSSDIHKGQWLNLLGAERFDCRIVSKLCICDFFLDNSSETSANFLTVLDTSSCCSLPTSWSFWMVFEASSRYCLCLLEYLIQYWYSTTKRFNYLQLDLTVPSDNNFISAVAFASGIGQSGTFDCIKRFVSRMIHFGQSNRKERWNWVVLVVIWRCEWNILFKSVTQISRQTIDSMNHPVKRNLPPGL